MAFEIKTSSGPRSILNDEVPETSVPAINSAEPRSTQQAPPIPPMSSHPYHSQNRYTYYVPNKYGATSSPVDDKFSSDAQEPSPFTRNGSISLPPLPSHSRTVSQSMPAYNEQGSRNDFYSYQAQENLRYHQQQPPPPQQQQQQQQQQAPPPPQQQQQQQHQSQPHDNRPPYPPHHHHHHHHPYQHPAPPPPPPQQYLPTHYGAPAQGPYNMPYQGHIVHHPHDAYMYGQQPAYGQPMPAPTTLTTASSSYTQSTTTASAPTPATAAAPSSSTKPVKKYVCSHCQRSFTTSGHLARHTRIHTGEKNYECPHPECSMRFSRQDNCMQHYRTHLGGRSRNGGRGRGRKNASKDKERDADETEPVSSKC